jgi:uncharacterized membrane protein YfcA
MDWILYLQLFASGIFAGILGGLLGIGGGIIYVLILPPILYKIGVSETEIVAFTIANSLFSTVFTTLSGNIKQASDNNFHLKTILLISTPGIILSYILIRYFINTPYYSKDAFNVIYISLVLLLLTRLLVRIKQDRNKEKIIKTESTNPINFLFTGLLGGFVSPLTGLGGGLVIVPILHIYLHFPIKKANAISLGVICITALFSSVFNMLETPTSSLSDFSIGFIVIPLVAFLSAGGIIGAMFGIELSKKMKSGRITILFAAFLVLVLVKKLLEIYNQS